MNRPTIVKRSGSIPYLLLTLLLTLGITACDSHETTAGGLEREVAQIASSSSITNITHLDVIGPFDVKRNTTGAWAMSANGQPADRVTGYNFSWRVDTEWPFDDYPNEFLLMWPETGTNWWYGTGTGDIPNKYYIQGTATNTLTGQSVSTPLYAINVLATGGSEGGCVTNSSGQYVYPCVGSTVVYPGQGGSPDTCQMPSTRRTCACKSYADTNPRECSQPSTFPGSD